MSGLQHVKNTKRMAIINGEVVPGRDLTEEEVKHFGRAALIASGLYQQYKAEKPKTVKEPKTTKPLKEERENKK